MELTLLGRADEVPDTPNAAVIFALRFVQLHAHPLATGELCGATEAQRARLGGRQERYGLGWGLHGLWWTLAQRQLWSGKGKGLGSQLRHHSLTGSMAASLSASVSTSAKWELHPLHNIVIELPYAVKSQHM